MRAKKMKNAKNSTLEKGVGKPGQIDQDDSLLPEDDLLVDDDLLSDADSRRVKGYYPRRQVKLKFCPTDEETSPEVAASDEPVKVLTEEGWDWVFSRRCLINMLGRSKFKRIFSNGCEKANQVGNTLH